MMLDSSTTPTATTQAQSLPGLIDRAAKALASAKTAAEVLEAMAAASFAYDAADTTARMARLKKADEEVIATAYRAQADALAIEAQAKRRTRRRVRRGVGAGERSLATAATAVTSTPVARFPLGTLPAWACPGSSSTRGAPLPRPRRPAPASCARRSTPRSRPE